VWSAATGGAGVVNLNADLVISVNGIPVDTIASDVTLDFGPVCGCSVADVCSGCGGNASCFVGIPGCGCACGILISADSGPHALNSGDTVTVTIVPARGGVSEADTADDSKTATFSGEPIVWHRRIESVRLDPSPPVRDGEGAQTQRDIFVYDVDVALTSATRGIDYGVDLSADVELLVNGVPTASISVSRLHDPILCSQADPPPKGTCSPTVSCSAGAGVPLECQPDCLDCSLGGCSYPCWCTCQWSDDFFFSAVPLDPGDEITVLLRPAPGALPELPGLEGDDSASATLFCPRACGDIDDSGGNVDLNDFASFAVCFNGSPSSSAACACSDLNGDGLINLLDFATLSLIFNGSSTNVPPNCP
jgi:hypothetical protein